MARKYRHWTFFFRRASRGLSYLTLDPLEKLAVMIGLIKKPKNTLLWTKEHSHLGNPVVSGSSLSTQPNKSNASPSISFEMTNQSAAAPYRNLQFHEHDTPALAHSVFPPAIRTHRPRAGSHGSNSAPSRSPLRESGDSSRPLIQRPSEAYCLPGDGEGRPSDEMRVSFEDTLSHASPPEQGSGLGRDTMLQGRQGYRRANSGAGSPSIDGVSSAQGGLGIRFGDEDLERGMLHDQV
jgi:hypothetical protein